MTRACVAGLVGAIGASLYATLALGASVSGPVPARTGGFGEMTCQQCHWDNELNDPGGSLQISGIPSSYTPGQSYTITLRVSHPELMRAGFQISARFADGAEAGGFASPDDRAETVPDDSGSVHYLQHTRTGSQPATAGAGEWVFAWTAPPDGRTVQFHAAANAANGDASPLGDFIYTASMTSDTAR